MVPNLGFAQATCQTGPSCPFSSADSVWTPPSFRSKMRTHLKDNGGLKKKAAFDPPFSPTHLSDEHVASLVP